MITTFNGFSCFFIFLIIFVWRGREGGALKARVDEGRKYGGLFAPMPNELLADLL